MKILMINKFLYPNGGSETYIFELGKYLEKKGHEVQYFGMEHEGRCVGNNVNAYTSDMDFHNGDIFSKLTYPIKTIYSKESRAKIRKVLEDFQPDICHINNFNYQLTPSILLEIKKWNKNCRIIMTAHDYQLVCPNHMLKNPNTDVVCEKCLGGHYLECFKGKCIHGSSLKSLIGTCEATYWNMNKVYENIDTIICCSEFLKTKFDTNKVLAKKTVVLHNFLPKPIKSNSPVTKSDYVLYFGRYSKEKGIETLIDVCKSLPNIPFIFAGKGELLDKIQTVPNIKEIGFQTGEDLEKLIREAKFSIYPSEWYENCPFSIIESEVLGTPVIGAKIGGIPELIEDGKNGFLFESKDKKELKEQIDYLYNDKELLDEMIDNCLNNTKFMTIEKYYNNLIKIYNGIGGQK